MTKYQIDFKLVSNDRCGSYHLLKLTPSDDRVIPEMLPGQFAELEVATSKTTFLRRPISINYVDRVDNTLWLLIRNAGNGTVTLCNCRPGEIINIVIPLGNGFSFSACKAPLLIGGGVGSAPLLYLAECYNRNGIKPTIILGGRTANDVAQAIDFQKYGDVYFTTEDGSIGDRGYVVDSRALASGNYDMIQCCGPKPMMKAVAAKAREMGIDCEVSLENMMACGLGACLCCVEKNAQGHNVCVCTEGPVFNINELSENF